MYRRLRALKNLEKEKVQHLQNSKVAIIGLGATGSVIAESLARYGVNLKIFDRDYLEKNDLYSSSLYTKAECKKSIPKAEAVEQKLKEFTEIEKHVESLDAGNVKTLDDVDLIIDATDNMETRFLIDEYCQKNGKTWIYTAALADQGYSMLFEEKCFSCVFKKVRPGKLGTCRTEGILRDIAALTAHKTSLKAFKWLTGQRVEEKLEIIPQDEIFEVESEGCEVCQKENFSSLKKDESVASICGEDKYQIKTSVPDEAFEKLKKSGEVIKENKYLVRANLEDKEFTLYRSGGALIEAENKGHAKSRLSEIVGI